jgi:hypothetical protein
MELVIMGNRHIDILSSGHDDLKLALKLLANGQEATHYVVDGEDLVLLWGAEKDATAFLYPLTEIDEVVAFVEGWLGKEAVYRVPYPPGGDTISEPKGFRAYCGPWGKDEKYNRGFARVEARYVWIGK